MKSTLVLGALALSVTLSGVAFAADMPAAAPPPALAPVTVVDPITGALTTILTPVGQVIDGVVVQPITAVGNAILPPPPPPPPVVEPVVYHHHHHHHWHHHHHAM
ncbi:hypothetical protein [Beijerinckia sp. L45]|uniref:hypothetical protein n=1 Tax=Beijerinckia sp. L45 TaxID=1641855 RepID=UPI00131BAC5A|nr:hypothetical protein [Beijerinckia sp. L45]